MATVTQNLVFDLNFVHALSVQGVNTEAQPRFYFNLVQASGTAINQQNQLWFHKGRTLAASANEDIDLSGSKSDAFGTTITFAKIKGIYIRNTNVAVGDTLQIGTSATNQFLLFDAATDSMTLGPGAVFYWNDPSAAGKTVTATTGDLFGLTETGGVNTCTFDIAIWGTE